MKLLVLLLLAIASAVYAAPAHFQFVAARHLDQNVPSTSDQNFISTVMNAHWFWRRMHCAQELVWDPNLAQLALDSVTSCSHSIQHVSVISFNL